MLSLWRVTTAVRTFALALVAGSTLGTGTFGAALPLLAALILTAAVSAVLEWDATTSLASWVPVGEVTLTAILLTSAPAPTGVLIYLAVPPLVAGIRHGLVMVLNAGLVGCLVTVVTFAVAPQVASREQVAASLLRLTTGLGLGVLASWQSREARDLKERQAPYATAHQLMAQLHGMIRRGNLGLDSHSMATDLATTLRDTTGADHAAVFVDGVHALHMVTAQGDAGPLADAVRHTDATASPGVLVLPLRSAGDILGVVALGREQEWSDADRREAQAITDDHALPLSTAFLFDGVRTMATAEERSRIAREMHDGVAQEVVALGYVVDEIASTSSEPNIQDLAGSLRDEISRVVTELRLSIFDLRQDVSDHLSGALAECLRVTCDDTALEAHLTLQESGPPLPARTQVELLRVAQEAIGNVRRHAGAENIWVSLVSDGSAVVLEVADDGVGSARPRDRHWGLQTMRERARTIGAELTVSDREPRGTVVRLQTNPATRRELLT